MLKQSKKNKIKQAFYELSNLCKECKFKEEIDCLEMTRDCGNYNKKFEELYLDSLYPKHPCNVCLVNTMCEKPCDPYIHHENMRDVAESELLGQQIYFSKNKRKLLQVRPDSIPEEYLKQMNFDGEKIDLEFTRKYIEDIKNDPSYKEILETEKQRLEYFHKKKFIEDENERTII